mmetsp:Transcript_39297/g.94503  ORF Transcript_39297/g.94503 Transcript_39297/m.94503 type:complete len:280 (+) Transcript_39297:62-901(+)
MHRVSCVAQHVRASLAPAAVSGYENILVEKRDNAVAIVTLNRPKALNALNNAVMTEVVAAFKGLDQDDDVRVIILTGSGEKAFAAGADIKEMNSRDFAEVAKMDMFWAWQQVREVRKPIIAAVNGFALGGGCEVAMLCDVILASENAKFGQPEINLGTIPGMGGSQRLVRAVGKSKAMEWVLGGNQFTAAEAERAGLVSRVVPLAQLLPEAIKLAELIASKSGPVVQFAKEAVNQAYESSLSDGLLLEKRLFHSTWGFEDRKEGMTAFTEKRKPDFKHK